jgi:HAD superfamily phosphoserine phosphatase-like hydrolase
VIFKRFCYNSGMSLERNIGRSRQEGKGRIFKVSKEVEKIQNPVFKIAIFDLEGPLVEIGRYRKNIKIGGMWRLIFEKMSMLDEYARLRKKYVKKGEDPNYMQWTRESCESLKKNGLTKKEFLRIVESQPLREGAKETISALKAQGFKTAIVTGCFSDLARKAQENLGIDFVVSHCNLKFDEKGKLENWNLLECDFEGKANYIKQIAQGFGFATSQCVYVGNGFNDVPAFQTVGHAIVFNPHEKNLKSTADDWITGANLTPILKSIAIATKKEMKANNKNTKRNVPHWR